MFVALLQACGGQSADENAGIEVGNPSIQLSARFVLDYGDRVIPETNLQKGLSRIAALSESDIDSRVVITDFKLDLRDVRYYSSYYIYVPFDPEEGLRIWPPEDEADEDSLSVDFLGLDQSDTTFNRMEIPSDGLLKEVGFSFAPRNQQTQNQVRGFWTLDDGTVVPFIYQLPDYESFQLRFHYSQLDIEDSSRHDTIAYTVQVRFLVKEWINDVLNQPIVVGADGLARFDASNNPYVWSILNDRFASSFSSLRWKMSQNGVDTLIHHPQLLSHFDKPGQNIVRNHDFSRKSEEWIFVQQYDGKADTAFQDDNVMIFDISDGGSQKFSIQLIQEDVALLEGRRYRMGVRAWTDVPGPMAMRTGIYRAPYTGISPQVYPRLTQTPTDFNYEFVPKVTDPYARLELNLGQMSRRIYLQSVWLVQLN